MKNIWLVRVRKLKYYTGNRDASIIEDILMGKDVCALTIPGYRRIYLMKFS